MSYRHPSFEYPNEGTKANSLETCLQPVRPTAPKCRHNHFRAHQEHADGIGVVFMCTLVLIANFVTCHRSLDGDPQQHQCGWAMPTSGDWTLTPSLPFSWPSLSDSALTTRLTSPTLSWSPKAPETTRWSKLWQAMDLSSWMVGSQTFWIHSSLHVLVGHLPDLFKMFFLVLVFGLFHGLLFLPLVLSLFGSRAFKTMGLPKRQQPNYTAQAQPLTWSPLCLLPIVIKEGTALP